jgi:hypothetical protein
MAIKVESGVTKRMTLNSQCINQIRLSENHDMGRGLDSGKIGKFFQYIRGIPPFGELPFQN